MKTPPFNSMIYFGEQDKIKIIKKVIAAKNPKGVFVIGEDIDIGEHQHISYADTILYKFYYDLQAKISADSLVIFNEAMVSKNRYQLNYNCMRKYVLARPHRLIFQYYPIKQKAEDVMILFDLDSDSPFLKQRYEDVNLFADVGNMLFDWNVENVVLSDKDLELYYKEKDKIIASVKQDPDVIPRRLLKFSEKLNEKYCGAKDRKDIIKPVMNIGLNQTGVDDYYFNEMLNFKKEVENVANKILR